MSETAQPEFQPALWWRYLSEVTDRLFVCGDLSHHSMNPTGF